MPKKKKKSPPRRLARKARKPKKATNKVAKRRVVKRVKKVKKKPVRRRVRKTAKGKRLRALSLRRSPKNPIIGPANHSYWESEAVFNPGTVMHGGRIHLFYRALGPDGISRIGYASSKDGIHFDKRHAHPVYMPETSANTEKRFPYTSPARLSYNRVLYASGGGWGGCEDPRAVKIGDRVYITFNIFNGWESIRVGLTSISQDDLENERWNWSRLTLLSPPKERHKNWVLFPDKIDGKFALFHNLHDLDPARVRIEYIDDIEGPPVKFESPDPHLLPNRIISWHNRTRSIGPPPIKTRFGWLVFYHAMDKNDPGRYKLGAMILDSKDPTRILYRSKYPVLEPDEWYENDWKPGIIYASGAVVKGDTLFIYYGGGDKYVGVAYTNLTDFAKKLMRNEHAVLTKKSIKVA